MPTTIRALIDYLIGEYPPERQGRFRAAAGIDDLRDRALLAALLTVRPPAPLTDSTLAELEALLAEERDARGVVDPWVLPTLSEQGIDIPGFPNGQVALWRGDLVRLRADAIVNAANPQLLGCFAPDHRCIDNVIHAAAGPRLRLACREHMDAQGHLEPVGTATVTPGFVLPARHVIHTVGPTVHGDLTDAHKEALARAYLSILDAARDTNGVRSVGLCSVSTGVYGFPKEAAASIAIASIAGWFAANPASDLRIVVSLFAEVDERAYRTAIAERIHA